MTRSNAEIFQQYDTELKLKIYNQRNLRQEKSLLRRFQDYLGEQRPTTELDKLFIYQYTDRSKRTLVRYASTI